MSCSRPDSALNALNRALRALFSRLRQLPMYQRPELSRGIKVQVNEYMTQSRVRRFQVFVSQSSAAVQWSAPHMDLTADGRFSNVLQRVGGPNHHVVKPNAPMLYGLLLRRIQSFCAKALLGPGNERFYWTRKLGLHIVSCFCDWSLTFWEGSITATFQAWDSGAIEHSTFRCPTLKSFLGLFLLLA